MKGKPIYSFFWLCLAVMLLIQFSGLKVFAQEIYPYPMVLESDPESNQENVPLSKDITIIFTAPMNPVTTAAAFHFYKNGTDEVLNNLKDYGELDISGGNLTFFPFADLLPGTDYWIKIKSTATDQQGNLLDGDHDGVGEEGEDDDWVIRFTTAFQGGPFPTQDHWSPVYGPSQGLGGKITCAAIDSRDYLWVVTNDEDGIYRFNGYTWDNKTFSLNCPQADNFPCMAADRQGRLWVGLDTSLQTDPNAPRLARWEEDTWLKVSAKNLGLDQDEVILKIALDSLGNIWMITSGSKVIRYRNGQAAINYPIADITGGGSLTALTIDNQNNVWVGTAVCGAYKLPRGLDTWVRYSSNEIQSISDMGTDQAGNIWIGATNGVFKLNPSGGTSGSWTRYTNANTAQGLPGNFVISLAVDSGSGAVWAGTSSGMGQFDGETQWTNFAVDNVSELSDQKINTLAVNQRGEVWLGTDDGLMKWDDVKPYIVLEESSPTDDTLVDQTVRIRIVFSEPMRQDTVTSAFTLMDAARATVDVECNWLDERTLEFTPLNGVLDANRSYTFIMATSVPPTDLAGNPLASEEYEVNFSIQGDQQYDTRLSPSYGDDVNLSGSGCFIDSVSHQSGTWLRRIMEFLCS